MKSKVLPIVISLGLFFVGPASAAVKPKPVKMLELPHLIESNFFQGNGGQWFATLHTKKSIYLIGTSEPAVGPTTGEVIALDPVTGVQQWDLPIPVGADAIATAATLDSQGNIWVAGSEAPNPAVAPISTAAPFPTNAVNPGNVSVDPVLPTRSSLNHLALWEITASGSLLNTFTFDAGNVFEPLSLKNIKGTFKISGRDFQVTVSNSGKFTNFIQASYVPAKLQSTYLFKDGLYLWKSYISKGAIAGVVGWKPKSPTRVILKIGSRTGNVYLAHKVDDEILDMSFLPAVGLVITTQTANGYALSLLK